MNRERAKGSEPNACLNACRTSELAYHQTMATVHAFVARLALLALVLSALGCGDDASSMLPPGVTPGVYHLHFARAGDLVGNLELDPNGTFRWGGGGFDSPYEGDGGRWRASNGRLVLTPIGATTSFAWPVFLADSGSFPLDVYGQLESRPPPTTLGFGPGSVSLTHRF